MTPQRDESGDAIRQFRYGQSGLNCPVCGCGHGTLLRTLLRCPCDCHQAPPMSDSDTEKLVRILGTGCDIKAVPDA
jgi:hypothetical protein